MEEVNVAPQDIRELMRIFHETGIFPLRKVLLSAMQSLRYETFSLPVEDRIALEQALDGQVPKFL